MSDERQPCRSCAGIFSDFSLFDALISEEGVNFSQTAQEFYTAVDNGCLICSEIHERDVAMLRCQNPQRQQRQHSDVVHSQHLTRGET